MPNKYIVEPREHVQSIQELHASLGHSTPKTALQMGIAPRTLRDRMARWAVAYPDIVFEKSTVFITDETLQLAVNTLAQQKGNKAEAARVMGVTRNVFKHYTDVAELKGIVASVRGNSDARAPKVMPLPAAGTVKRYILTCAQNNTLLHDPTWSALKTLAGFYDAEIFVATLTYVHALEGSAKRGTASKDKSKWYDPRIEMHVNDDMVQLAPGLIWNGHTNIIPTAIDPLSGWENYNFRASSIFPHVKCAMKSIPTVRQDAAKLQYTTGTTTQRNYIQKKSGQRAEFDHVYGGLIVEVTSDGAWFVRQLNVDSSGKLYDLDVCVMPDGTVANTAGVEAIQFGDVHVAQLEDEMTEATWGPGGMVDALNPRFQFMHDILDFESRSHHNLRDPFKMFELHTRGRDSVEDEIKAVGSLLRRAARKGCKTVIVQSNHDLHFERWLREGSWKIDPRNALIHAKATSAFLEAIHAGQSFNALKWALAEYAPVKGLVWADPDEGFVILKDRTGGLEMGLHGDLGPNGSRGSIRNLARLGRKVCIGHSHSAGIYNGAYQSGVKAKLGMDYARGAPSSWTQTDIVVYPNGKRQLITWWNGKYRA